MRVIAGSLGGRQFASPHGHRTHPMSDKMRGAIFNALGDISGLTVLDAFSGSGALAIEAISRGASSALAVESETGAQRTIRENAQALGITDSLKAIRAYVAAWSTRNEAQTFDIIFADPPYDAIPYRDLEKLPKHLKATGMFVLSWPGHDRVPPLKGLSVVQTKDYGDGSLAFYRRIS
jgi:16S rRNA (guanine966-N2)-methyltransferase